jgi:arylsulfatase A-like enzyme
VPNIVLILADDMGFSDLGCYGSEILTPNLDALAKGGLRFTQFYNTARCCPTRAALLTGLYPHQVGMGHMTEDRQLPGYRGNLVRQCATIADLLGAAGYQTMMAGKWHVTRHVAPEGPKHTWPLQRGFEKFFGTIHGGGSYFDPVTLCRDNLFVRATGDFYYTEAISEHAARFIEEAARRDRPFFLYVAYTAPHWPLHAREELVARYRGKYAAGWDALREQRQKDLVRLGIVRPEWPLTPRDPQVPPWTGVPNRRWNERRMEVYAAQIDAMDQGIGRILEKLKQVGAEQNTLVMFLSDNGGCAEEIGANWQGLHIPTKTRDGGAVQVGNNPSTMPGPADTFQSYGLGWANASNTPFRLYKHWVHEGGIAAPLIAHWPAGIKQGGRLSHQPGHVVDILATCLDLARTTYPESFGGLKIAPTEGMSLGPIFRGEQRERAPIFWEHEGNRAVRDGKWKLVAKYRGAWELYDMEADRTETNDLAEKYSAVAKYMNRLWEQWADRTQVEPWPMVTAKTAKP